MEGRSATQHVIVATAGATTAAKLQVNGVVFKMKEIVRYNGVMMPARRAFRPKKSRMA